MRKLFLLSVCWALAGAAQAQNKGHRIIQVDQNYKEVSREKDAVYIVELFEFSDTVYFETRSRNPKGLIEKGKYPVNQGFDLRNCWLQRLWPNGNLRAQGELKNSWNEGVWQFFDESGKLYSEVEFVTGMITGTSRRYYDAHKFRTYSYLKNLKEGESYLADTAGRLLQVCNYSRDTLHGLNIEYFESGKIKRKTLYNHGIIVTDSGFYEAGNVFNCEVYDEKGELHGRCMMYTAGGKIARLDEYVHGELVQNECRHQFADADWNGDDCPPRRIKAEYPGGLGKYMEFVSVNQEYPDLAINWRQQGVVIYEFTINNYGFVEDITEENIIPLGYGLEKESLRLLKKMQRFEPERINGRSVSVRMQMPYVFILQE